METTINKVTPTIEQMRHLQSLGDKCEGASMVYHPASAHSEIFKLEVGNVEHKREFWAESKRIALVGEGFFDRMHGRDVPAYTADDIMAKLPESILINGIWHLLFIGNKHVDGLRVFAASYSFRDDNGRFVAARQDTEWESTIFIQLLYAVYLWCVENKHINLTGKWLSKKSLH